MRLIFDSGRWILPRSSVVESRRVVLKFDRFTLCAWRGAHVSNTLLRTRQTRLQQCRIRHSSGREILEKFHFCFTREIIKRRDAKAVRVNPVQIDIPRAQRRRQRVSKIGPINPRYRIRRKIVCDDKNFKVNIILYSLCVLCVQISLFDDVWRI